MSRIVPIPGEDRIDELPVYLAGPVAPGWWGNVLFIATEAMLLACMIAGLFFLRATTGLEAEQLHTPKLQLPLLNTALLLSSSVVLWWAERRLKDDDVRRFRLGALATFLLGIAFLTVQGIEYGLKSSAQSGAYHSMFYAITGLHGSHVLAGMIMVAFTIVQSLRQKYDSAKMLAVQNVALYWHFVDAVWIIIVVTLYIWPHMW